MNDFQQPEPDDLGVRPDMGTRSARPRRSPSRMSTLGLVTAVVAALVAGPAVASRLGSIGTDPAGSYPNLGQVRQEAPLPKPTTTPENANQREGRTADPSPAPTGENANQREGRTADPSPAPTGENANQREGRTVEPDPGRQASQAGVLGLADAVVGQ